MSGPHDTVGMPRLMWAIRVVLVILLLAGITLVGLFDMATAPWTVGLGMSMAIFAGVALIIFTVLPFVSGAYIEPLETKDFHSSGHHGQRRFDDFGGGDFGGGDVGD